VTVEPDDRNLEVIKPVNPKTALIPSENFVFGVPLWRNPMELEDLVQYESALINLFCSRISRMVDSVLFDCGADIGIFTSAMCARSGAIFERHRF
jgi:hypothetical protein